IAAYEMMDLINNSLNLYKIEKGTYQCEPQPIPLADIVSRCMDESRTLAANLDIDFRFSKGDGDFQAMGEELLVYSLVTNLLRNAVEASPRGAVIDIALQRGSSAAMILIHNEGAIPHRVRECFFEKYVTSGKKQGTGLGTYSARLMAEVQQGSIEFETSDTHGTTLKVTLPRA
ncbi:MAG: HAMP domain-containing histidine kinase, partial [Gammaproteobacteria bacterium]|nr:HAMP domain-containing histidine kinase [Gammaproteobacteria bacterium]